MTKDGLTSKRDKFNTPQYNSRSMSTQTHLENESAVESSQPNQEDMADPSYRPFSITTDNSITSMLSEPALAVGIAFAKATDKHRHPRTTTDEVVETFEELGFRKAYTDVNIENIIRHWDASGLIASHKEPTSHWYGFIDTDNPSDTYGCTPKEFEQKLTQIANSMI